MGFSEETQEAAHAEKLSGVLKMVNLTERLFGIMLKLVVVPFLLIFALSGSAWDGDDEWPRSCCHRRSQFCANCREAIIRVSQT